MSDPPIDKTERWVVALAIFAFVSLFYIYFVAHRLDWVRYLTETYYWRVQALDCPGKQPEAVVVLSKEANSSPLHVLRYEPELARYLKTLPPAQAVKVDIKRKGYLWEFNYAGDQFVLSIGAKGIYPTWRKTADQLKGCTFEPAKTLDPTLLLGTQQ